MQTNEQQWSDLVEIFAFSFLNFMYFLNLKCSQLPLLQTLSVPRVSVLNSKSWIIPGLAHATGVHYQKSSLILLLWNNLNSDQIENWHRLQVSRLLPVGGMCFHWKVLWKEKITSQWWKIRLFWRPRVTFAVWSAHSLISPLQVIENKSAFSLSENNLWVFIISKTVSKNEKISKL